MPRYDHPNYLVVREKHITGLGISTPAVASGYVTSTLRTRNKAVIIGCAFRVASGGSASGTNSISIARLNVLGTTSVFKTLTLLMSAGASAAGDTNEINLQSSNQTANTLMTIHSIGEGAVLMGNAASLDKVAVLSDIIWRYRVLPGGDDDTPSI